MINSFEWMVAKRYLSSKGRDSYISVNAILSATAIALGVMAIISVMSILNGFRAELIDKILGYQGHVLVQGYGGRLEGYREIMKDLEVIKGVSKVTPFVESQALVTFNGNGTGVVVRGLPESDFIKGRLPVKEVRDGSLADAVEQNGLVIGYELARKLRIKVGDTITLVSPKEVNTPFGSNFRSLGYPVVAIIEIGIYTYDEAFIGMPMQEAQAFFSMGDAITTIEYFLDDPDKVDDVVEQFYDLVETTEVVDGVEKRVKRAHVTHWKLFNNAIVGAMEVERVAMFLVLSIIVLVAVFNVGSSLYMLVKDKSGDIAILRTMGARRGSIRRIFITVGMFVGVFGTLVGTICGFLIVIYIDSIKNAIEWLLDTNVWDPSVRFITSLRAEVDPWELGITIGVALLMSFLATIPPAMRAARLDPVEVLRHE